MNKSSKLQVEVEECRCQCLACRDAECEDCGVQDYPEPTCRCREPLPGNAMVA
jgi:hypothetical protein